MGFKKVVYDNPLQMRKFLDNYYDIADTQKFLQFVTDFNVFRLASHPQFEALRFLKILKYGIKFARGNDCIHFIRNALFDHDYLCENKEGKVFFVAMPHLDEKMSLNSFRDLVEKFSFPETIKIKFLNKEKYQFRLGSTMFLIYDETSIHF